MAVLAEGADTGGRASAERSVVPPVFDFPPHVHRSVAAGRRREGAPTAVTSHALEPDRDADNDDLARHGVVAGELLALQLHARGYTPAQIAALRTAAVADVVRDLRRVVWALGVGTLGDAIAEAKRRGLIV